MNQSASGLTIIAGGGSVLEHRAHMNASNYMSIATSMQRGHAAVDALNSSALERRNTETVNFGRGGGAISEPINFGLKNNGTGV